MFTESEMSELAERTTSKPLISSAAAFPVKTSATQDLGQASQEHKADYGLSSPESFASFDPATYSWRTLQLSLHEGSTLFSGRWPRSGTMRNGTAYQLPPLVRRTCVTAYILWPTPKANDDNRSPEAWEIARMRGYEKRKATGKSSGGPASARGSLSVTLRRESGQNNGQPNPKWIEWLMGFPIGWTDLED